MIWTRQVVGARNAAMISGLFCRMAALISGAILLAFEANRLQPARSPPPPGLL
jgi:hypothetical protein